MKIGISTIFLLLLSLLTGCEKEILFKGETLGSSISFPDTTLNNFRFLVMGDWGSESASGMPVAEAMADYVKEKPVELVLGLGDNFYPSGVQSVTDPRWSTSFETVYPQEVFPMPFYQLLGNHDYQGNAQAQIDYTTASTRWQMPDFYYTFSKETPDGVMVQFFCLDGYQLIKANYPAKQLQWFEHALKNSPAQWKIVCNHYPLYSNGKHGGEKILRERIERLLDKYNVDVYFCAHDHDQQILGPHLGVVHIVNGSASKTRPTGQGYNTIYAASKLGFGAVVVKKEHLIYSVITSHGTIDFTYEIKKLHRP